MGLYSSTNYPNYITFICRSSLFERVSTNMLIYFMLQFPQKVNCKRGDLKNLVRLRTYEMYS
jgi:hypothetical protein